MFLLLLQLGPMKKLQQPADRLLEASKKHALRIGKLHEGYESNNQPALFCFYVIGFSGFSYHNMRHWPTTTHGVVVISVGLFGIG